MNKYVRTKGYIDRHENIYPFWSDKLKYDEELEEFLFNNDTALLQDVLYDVTTGNLLKGIELEIYPSDDDLQHKIGEEVYAQLNSRKIITSRIKDVIFKKHYYYCKSGDCVSDYEKEMFPKINFKDELVYCFKEYKPTYVLESGEEIEIVTRLFKKEDV